MGSAMSRWYDENIQVATVSRSIEDDPAGESPERFVWRGRLYLVSEVLASWRERQPWWVLCDQAFDLASPRAGMSGAPGSLFTLLADGADRRCWRVRAKAGRDSKGGVYELIRMPSLLVGEQIVGGGAEAESHRENGGRTNRGADVSWRLTRVGD